MDIELAFYDGNRLATRRDKALATANGNSASKFSFTLE